MFQLPVVYIKFLREICSVKEERILFGLQVFTDIDVEEALQFWVKSLNCRREQFFKTTIVSVSGSMGTYTEKSKYGVCTVYVNNTKFRNWILAEIDKCADIAQW